MYIRALRATLNKTDQSFNSMSLYQSASYMSFVIPAWLTFQTGNQLRPPEWPIVRLLVQAGADIYVLHGKGYDCPEDT